MTAFVVVISILFAFFGIITLLDWMTRRKDRRSQNRPV